MMKESAAPAVNQQLIAMLRQQPAFIDAVFAVISGNPSILSLVARNIKDPGMKQMLNRAMGLSKKKNKAPMGQQPAMAQPAAPMGAPAQPIAAQAAPMAQPAGVMAPRASSNIRIRKYASGYYNTPSLPGQMFKSRDLLIKAQDKDI